MAVSVPGGAGRVIEREVRVSDLGITAFARFGLKSRSSTIGEDLSADFE